MERRSSLRLADELTCHDLIRYDGEAFASIAGARRFNQCVERQKRHFSIDVVDVIYLGCRELAHP